MDNNILIFEDEISIGRIAEGELTGREVEETLLNIMASKYSELLEGLRTDSDAGTVTFLYDNDIEGLRKAVLVNAILNGYEELF